jgi:hypothetical protein
VTGVAAVGGRRDALTVRVALPDDRPALAPVPGGGK